MLEATATILLDGALLATNGAILGYVARALWTREVPADARRANLFFAGWWASLAVVLGLSAAVRFLAAAGALTLPLYLATVQASLVLVCVGMAGLLYYLLFLLTGSGRLAWLTAYHATLFLVAMYYLAWSRPDGIVVAPWHVQAHFARAPDGWPLALVVVLLVGPLVMGALGYFSLYFRVREPGQRYRIALVSGAILAWAASSLLAGELELTQGPVAAVASRLVGIGAALIILVAYHPPSWVRRRLLPNAA